jgi:hypothetical protein
MQAYKASLSFYYDPFSVVGCIIMNKNSYRLNQFLMFGNL